MHHIITRPPVAKLVDLLREDNWKALRANRSI